MQTAVVFSQQEQRYAFKHFSISNGLVSNTVYSILQDNQGYMWFTTLDGLQRYDGNRFITFRYNSGDPNSIPADYINILYADKKNNLWLLAGNKAGILHTDNFKFETIHFEGEDPAHPSNILFLGEAINGFTAAFLEDKGLYVYNAKKNLFVQQAAFRFKEKEYYYYISTTGNAQFYWFALLQGLAVYNTKTGNINYRGHNPDNNFVIDKLQNDSAITAIYFSHNDSLWYGSWPLVAGAPFINILDLKTGKKTVYPMGTLRGEYTETGPGIVLQNGDKWFWGRSFVGRYTGDKKTPFQFVPNEYKDEQSIRFDHANSMYEDRQHNIWIASDNGIFIFNPNARFFNNYNLKHNPTETGKDGPLISACELNNGNFFVGSWGHGLYYFDSNFNAMPLPVELKIFNAPYSIWTIHQHSKTGLIWMGFQSGGIVVYDPVKHTYEMFENNIITKSTIRQIIEDDKGNLWFGMQNGSLVKWTYSPGADIHTGYSLAMPKNNSFINKLLFDKNAIWIATISQGLIKYDLNTNKVNHYSKASLSIPMLWSDNVSDVYRYNDSLLLIADGALDVLNTNSNSIKHISTETSLPSNTVSSIERDKSGILWLGMANQLCRFNFQKEIFSTFDKRDGIGYDLFNAAGDYQTKDGKLIYLTDKNFLVFKPESITAATVPGNVFITTFSLGHKSLSVDSLIKSKNVELKYNNTSVSIEFSSLNYTPQNKIHYLYMLDGIDKDWQRVASTNQAVYNYLPAGDYTFRVKSENTEGKQSAVTELHMHVIPPFWQTWWFLGFIVLVILATFYYIDRERIKKLQALQAVRRQIAQNLHNDVNTTLNHISLLSEMAKIKADKDVERSKEYIGQISDKSRTMIDSMDDMLWTLNPQNDSMEKTILRMKEYAEAVQNSFPVKVFMEVDEKVNDLKLDMKVRHEMFLIFKKVLRTIGEEASNSESFVNIDKAGNKLLFKIQNSEVKFSGITAEQILKEITHRAETINAELDVQNDSKGISFILLVSI